MAWGAIIGGILSAVGGGLNAKGSSSASNAQEGAAHDAMQYQQQTDAQNRADLAPWLDAGKAALNEQRKQLGLPAFNPSSAANFVPSLDTLKKAPTQYQGTSGDMYYDPATGQSYLQARKGANAGQFVKTGQVWSQLVDPAAAAKRNGTDVSATTDTTGGRYGAFETSPGYLFTYDEANRALTSANAAKGRVYSGAQLREATRQAAGLASTEYGNYYARLAGLSGTGSTTATNLAGLNQASSNNIQTGAYMSGASRASGISAQSDIWSQVAGNLGNVFADWWSKNRSSNNTGEGLDSGVAWGG